MHLVALSSASFRSFSSEGVDEILHIERGANILIKRFRLSSLGANGRLRPYIHSFSSVSAISLIASGSSMFARDLRILECDLA